MVFAEHIRDALAVSSKVEMTDTNMDQVAKLTEQNSQLIKQNSQLSGQLSLVTDQKAQLSEQNLQISEQLSLITEQNAQLQEDNTRLQEENTVLGQRVSDLERSVGLDSSNSSKPPSSDGLRKAIFQRKQTHAKPARHFKSQVWRPTRAQGDDTETG